MILLLAASAALFLLDQYSKSLVDARLAGRCISCGPVLRFRREIHLHESYGRGGSRASMVAIWLAAVVCAVLLNRSGAWLQSHVALFGVGLALGGAAGNLLDILRWRGVIDFIDLRWWPVFNLADVGIVAGLALAFWPVA